MVTATGYEQDVKYAPASISVIPKEEITNRPIKDLGDIVQDVAGVSIDTSKTGISTIGLRGMHEEYTLILIDGKRVTPSKGIDTNGYNSAAGYIPPTSMIERVEIIKGPASLMYGSDAMGGVINIITKKVPDKTTASINIETRLQEHRKNWGNTYGFNGSVFHPITKKLSVNLRGKMSYSEQNHIYWEGARGYTCVPNLNQPIQGQGTNCENPYAIFAPAAYQTANVGGRLNFVANERNSFYFDTDFTFQRIGTLNTSPRQMGEYRDYERFNLLLNHDGDYSFGRFNNFIQFNTISQITHFYKYYDSSRLNLNVNKGRDPSTLLYNPIFSAASTFTKNFDFGDAGILIFNAGPSFMHERSYDRGNGNDLMGYQAAIFGEGEYFPFDWFSATAGLRVTYANIYGIYAAPRAYLNFYPTSWLTLKAGFAGGFQVPDLKMRFDGYYTYNESPLTTYYGNKDLKLEKSYNYEVTAMADTPLANFSITGYYTDYADAISSRVSNNGNPMLNTTCQVQQNGDTQCLYYINVGKAKLWGVEFAMNSKALLGSLFTQWGGGIYVNLNYAYTDTEQRTGDKKGMPLNDVPLHSLSGKLAYKTSNWEIYSRYKGTFKRPTSEITLSQGYTKPEYYKDLHLVDLGVNYRFKNGINVGLVVNNLLDKDTTREYFMWRQNFAKSMYSTMVPRRNYWLTIGTDF